MCVRWMIDDQADCIVDKQIANADAAIVHGVRIRRVQYPAALTLRRLADENFHGLRLADPREPLELLRNDLPLLNEVRHHV